MEIQKEKLKYYNAKQIIKPDGVWLFSSEGEFLNFSKTERESDEWLKSKQ